MKVVKTTIVLALVALLAVSAGLLLIGSAAAQEANETSQNGNETSQNGNETIPSGESIDGNTIIVDRAYYPGSEEAELTLYSQTLQQVSITDVSPYKDGGVMNQRSITLRPGQNTTIRMDVDPASNGFVGLSVATNEVLYAVPLEDPGIGLGAPKQNDLMALLIGTLAPVGAGLGIEWWNSRKRKRGVVRIDG